MSVLLLLLIAFVVSHAAFVIDKVQPVIGVLSIPPSAQSDQLGLNISMIDTSYSKYLWGAGAVVVPIFFHQSEDEIKQQFEQLDGVLFTGGPNKPTDFDRYYKTASLLLNLASENSMPLWGTCLGFQMISDLMAKRDVLGDFDSWELELPLKLTSNAVNSRMFESLPSETVDKLTSNSYTTNWHHYGVSPENFSLHVAPAGMIATSVNIDRNGLAFVSTMEHQTLPIYATQWHPEANAYDRDHKFVDHSQDAIKTMQDVANFFIEEARKNGLGRIDSRLLKTIEDYPVRQNPLSDGTLPAFFHVFE